MLTTHESNLSCNKSACCKLREYWLQRSNAIHAVTSLAARRVCLGPVKRATLYRFYRKSRTTLDLLQHICATWKNLICCKTGLNVVSKTRNIAFDSFRCHVVKQVARFCYFSWTNLLPRVSLLSRDGKNGETLERDCINYIHIEPRADYIFNLKYCYFVIVYMFCIS